MGKRLSMVALAVGLLIAACGTNDEGPVPAAVDGANFPVTVRGAQIPGVPQRIVSLSATHSEVLYEIGAGPQIVATDNYSDYPAAADATDKIDAFNLSVEAVAALEPDLVILSFDSGDAVTGLAALGIPTVLFPPPGPANLDEVYDEWRELGRATGRADEANALVERVSKEIAGIEAKVPSTHRPNTYYLELDSSFYAAGVGSLLDTILGTLGMQNIANASDGPFPQLSSEYIIAADPLFVILADTVCCGQSADSVSRRPGWNSMTAVNNGDIIELDDAVASRWGPRVVDLVRVLAREVYGIE